MKVIHVKNYSVMTVQLKIKGIKETSFHLYRANLNIRDTLLSTFDIQTLQEGRSGKNSAIAVNQSFSLPEILHKGLHHTVTLRKN